MLLQERRDLRVCIFQLSIAELPVSGALDRNELAGNICGRERFVQPN